MSASSFNPALERIDEEAAAWFARRRSGQMTAADIAELELWLARDAEHRQAFDMAERMWSEVEGIRSDPRIIAIRERGQSRPVASPARSWVGPAVAASLAIAGLGGWALIGKPELGAVSSPARQEFRTSVGQRTTVTLSDGSIVTLDTDTVLRTIDTRRERRIVLEKGRAFFRVAKDASRPFIVVAGDRTITAKGTAFDVNAARDRFEVILVEGEVKVDRLVSGANGRARTVHVADVAAGSRLSTVNGQKWALSPVDAAKETSWLSGQLTYDDQPLSDVVADMNRYSDKKIVLLDEQLAHQPLSGVYKAGDVEEFVRILKEYRIAEVRFNSESRIALARIGDEKKSAGL